MTQFHFWAGFNLFVLAMLTLDLVVHRKAHVIKMREALGWSAFWISMALGFGVFIYYAYNNQWAGMGMPSKAYPQGLSGWTAMGQYLTAYIIEESLSVDNLFVFLMIFGYFGVRPEYQHRVLFWGILGAIVMRALFILLGMELIHHFHWLIYLFGAFLIFTGIKMAIKQDEEVNPERNPLLKLTRKILPVSSEYHGARFFTRENARLVATPMFIVLLVVESTDVMFATDSIPAVIAITHDRFIAYTSNIFAILGLRSLYFALAGMMNIFHFLHYGLSLILVFVGTKMLIAEYYKLPIFVALGIVVGILGLSVVLSLLFPRKAEVGKPEKVEV